MKTKVLDSQSLWDIALQKFGDVSGVFELAASEELSLTEELAIGQELETPGMKSDVKTADYYSEHRIIPATAITIASLSGEGGLLLEGIEFWGIEYDFIIN